MGFFDKLNRIKNAAISIPDTTDRLLDQTNALFAKVGLNGTSQNSQVKEINSSDNWERTIYCHNCGTYLQPITFCCPKCGAINKSAVQLYPQKRRNSKKDLLEWQKIIVYNSPNRLVYNYDQLVSCTTSTAQRILEIITESQELVNNTVNPEVYFSRYDLLYDELIKLLRVEPFYNFAQGSPSDSISQLCQLEEISNRAFIDRYYSHVSEKAQALKTTKGKTNRYNSFYDSLKPYFSRLSPNNIAYIEKLYHDALQKVDNGEVLIDKRFSNKQRIQQDIDQILRLNGDLAVVYSNPKCPICSQYMYTVYSISGNNKHYPKLPEEVINQTHSCPLHSMSLSAYFEGISTPPDQNRRNL